MSGCRGRCKLGCVGRKGKGRLELFGRGDTRERWRGGEMKCITCRGWQGKGEGRGGRSVAAIKGAITVH